MATTATDPAGPAKAPEARRMSPRKRRRHSLAVQYGLFVAVILVVAFSVNWADIQEYFLDVDEAKKMWPKVITVGLVNTIIYSVSGYVLAFVFGLLIPLMRLSSGPPYRWVALIYVEIFRGLPLLLV